MNNQFIGLMDSNSNPLKIGQEVTISNSTKHAKDLHGNYCIYEIVQKGIIPFFSYIESEKGQIKKKGSIGCPVTDYYFPMVMLFSKDVSKIRPRHDILIKDY